MPLPGNQLHPFLDPANSFQTADLGIKIIVFNYFDVRQSTLDKAFVFFFFFFFGLFVVVFFFFFFPFFHFLNMRIFRCTSPFSSFILSVINGSLHFPVWTYSLMQKHISVEVTDRMTNSKNPDETSRMDLLCLQGYHFWSAEMKILNKAYPLS